MTDKKSYCHGCRNDFYNGNNSLGVKQCMHFKGARVVRRFRIGWWTRPETPDNFREVKTLTCHSAPGNYADFERLPAHIVALKRKKART